MALTYPLAHAAFADLLVPEDFRWQLQRFVEISGTSRGDVITAEIGAAKWQAQVSLNPMRIWDAGEVQARVEALEGMGSGGTFLLYDLRKAGMQRDRTGALIAGYSPTVHTVGENNKSLRITGLRPGYVILCGDMIQVTYGSSPVRHALFRAVESVAANGAGLSPTFEVTPNVKAGITPGKAVTLYKASARMMIAPGSYTPGRATGRFVTGMAFSAIEVRG